MIEPFPEEQASPLGAMSFDALFTEGFAPTVRALVLLGADRATAEDLAQEAFGLALHKWGEIGSYDRPLSWVGKTAVNLWISHCRTSGRRRSLLAKSDLSTPAARHDQTKSELRIDLVRALGQLPQRQREVLALHYILDQPVSAVARTLEVSEGTIKSQLHDGRQALARLMAGPGCRPDEEGGSDGPDRE